MEKISFCSVFILKNPIYQCHDLLNSRCYNLIIILKTVHSKKGVERNENYSYLDDSFAFLDNLKNSLNISGKNET